jgi:glutamyl/glutaminyl-tRNA synthetase
LLWLNDQYITNTNDDQLIEWLVPLFKAQNIELKDKSYLKKVIQLLKPKIKLLPEFVSLGSYFFVDPTIYDEQAVQKYWQEPEVGKRLQQLNQKLNTISEFVAVNIERSLRSFAEELAISAAKLIHPTRLALTGFGVSPGLFELMEVLGKDTVLRRIQQAIVVLKKD